MSEVNESAAARRSRAIPSWRFVHVGRGRSKRGRPPLRQKNVPTSAKESQTASRQPLVFLDRGKLNSGRLLQAEETDRLGTPSLYSGSSEDGEDVATPVSPERRRMGIRCLPSCRNQRMRAKVHRLQFSLWRDGEWSRE